MNESPKGYPNVAAFIDSDESLTIYRRFGFLQARLLLNKQEELRRLEVKLERIEAMLSEDERTFSSLEVHGDPSLVEERGELLIEIETKFCAYSRFKNSLVHRSILIEQANLLTASQQMMAFNKPAEADRQNVGRYLWNRKPLVEVEASWIRHKEDLITLRAGRERAWLDGIVEGFLKLCHCKLIDVIFRSTV